ncbi:MAG: DUF523 domain-containing protein [Clostridia bacterium]|nr:DUF523 domain-containing protein [Clostridia bacterium]
MKPKLLISACLLGVPCRYDGKSKPSEAALALGERYELVPFCPECYGGLPTPRPPAEIRGDGVFTESGRDVTAEYRRGAESALALCQALGIKDACLKSRSPSCGNREVYDGTFSGTRVSGEGITVRLLHKSGIRVFSEEEIE